MSTTNIPVFIGRRSVPSVSAKTHVQTVSMGMSVDKNNSDVDACHSVAYVNRSSVDKIPTRHARGVTKYETGNFDIYDAFSDKFTIKNIKEEKSTCVPCVTKTFSDKFTAKHFKEEKSTRVTTKAFTFSDKFTARHFKEEKSTHAPCVTTKVFSDKFTARHFKEVKTTHVPCVTTKVFSDKFTAKHFKEEKTTHAPCMTTKAFSDKFTARHFKEEKSTHAPCVTTKVFSDKFTARHFKEEKTTINTVKKDSSKKDEVLKRKKICVELKIRNKENSLKSSLSEVSTNVTKSNSMLTMRKSNLIQIVLDENKNEKFQEKDNGKKIEKQTETHTKSIKNSDFKKVKRKKKLKQARKPPLTTKKRQSSGVRGSKCLDVGKDVTKMTKINKNDVNKSESGKTTSCIGRIKRKLKRKRCNSTSSNAPVSEISHSLNSSHSKYRSRRSHSRDRDSRSHSRDRDRLSHSRDRDRRSNFNDRDRHSHSRDRDRRPYSKDRNSRSYSIALYKHRVRDRHSHSRDRDRRPYSKDRNSRSYSIAPYKHRVRERYLHNRHSTDSQSSDSCSLSDSLLFSDEQSQNRSDYLDELDSYAREQLENSQYNNSRYPPHMYPVYDDINYSLYSGHRSKCSRSRSHSSDGTISENYSSCDSYCCDSQAACSHRKRLVISRSGGKRFVTFRYDRTYSKYKSRYKGKSSSRSGSKGLPSLASSSRVKRSTSPCSRVKVRRSSSSRSRINRSASPCSRVKTRRSPRSRSHGKSSSRSVSHGKDSVISCSSSMQSQTSTSPAEPSPKSRSRRKRSSKSPTHTSSSKLTCHATTIPGPLSSSDKMKTRTSRSSHKVKKNDTFIGEKISKRVDKFNENRKNIQRDIYIQQLNQKAMYLNTTETISDTRNTSDVNIIIKPGNLDSIVINSDSEPEAEVVIFKNCVEKSSRVMGQEIKELNSDIQKNMSDLILKTENKEKTHMEVSMLSQNVNSPITSTSRGLLSSNDKKLKQQKCGKNTDTIKQKVKINLTYRLTRILNMRSKTIGINAKRLHNIKRKISPKISKDIKSTNFASDGLELSTLVIEIGQDLHKIWNEYFEN